MHNSTRCRDTSTDSNGLHKPCIHRLDSCQLLRTIADNNIDDGYASIFDVHMNNDIMGPSCMPIPALMGGRSLVRSLLCPPPVLVQFGGEKFSFEGGSWSGDTVLHRLKIQARWDDQKYPVSLVWMVLSGILENIVFPLYYAVSMTDA